MALVARGVSSTESKKQEADRRPLYLCLALGAAALLVFGNVFGHEFIGLDDDPYVVRNLLVQQGLTFDGVVWAFTSVKEFYWHPLTWLSHMLVCQLFGLDAGWHHFVNVPIHAASAILLFLVLHRFTGALYRSAIAAALFSLHPLRVESIAWVAERKDVLAVFFCLLTLLVYGRYVKDTGSWNRYALVLVCFLCALMSKPTAMTLPALLLILDYWPLGRMRLSVWQWPLLREKLPLFAMSLACAIGTTIGQRPFIDQVSKENLSPLQRVLNVPLTYLIYVFKSAWPHPLALYYPYDEIPVWAGALCWIGVIAITLLAFRAARNRPYLAAGWLWFLAALLPTIWINARWDRFSYLPSIGLCVAAVWAAGDFVHRWKIGAAPVAAVTGAVLLAFAACSWVQVAYWHDRLTLFTHAVEVMPGNKVAQNNLGRILLNDGKTAEAIVHLSKAVSLDPEFYLSQKNLGNAYFRQGKLPEALMRLTEAARLKPDWGDAHFDRGTVLNRMGRTDEAIGAFEQALRCPLSPKMASLAHLNLGSILLRREKLEPARQHFSEAVNLDPGSIEARKNLGTTLGFLRKYDEAFYHFSVVLTQAPNDPDARRAVDILNSRPKP